MCRTGRGRPEIGDRRRCHQASDDEDDPIEPRSAGGLRRHEAIFWACVFTRIHEHSAAGFRDPT